MFLNLKSPKKNEAEDTQVNIGAGIQNQEEHGNEYAEELNQRQSVVNSYGDVFNQLIIPIVFYHVFAK